VSKHSVIAQRYEVVKNVEIAVCCDVVSQSYSDSDMKIHTEDTNLNSPMGFNWKTPVA